MSEENAQTSDISGHAASVILVIVVTFLVIGGTYFIPAGIASFATFDPMYFNLSNWHTSARGVLGVVWTIEIVLFMGITISEISDHVDNQKKKEKKENDPKHKPTKSGLTSDFNPRTL